MIQGYTPPQLLINETLTNVDSSTRERMSALIIGPQYVWPDVTTDTVGHVLASADPITYPLSFTDADDVTVTASPDNGYNLDPDSVKVWIENAEIELYQSPVSPYPSSLSGTTTIATPNVVDFSSVVVRDTASTTLSSGFHGRNLKIGDLAYVTEPVTGRTARRTVTGFVPTLSQSVDYSPAFVDSSSNPIDKATASTTLEYEKVVGNIVGVTNGLSGGYASGDAVSDHIHNGYYYIDENGAVVVGTKATITVVDVVPDTTSGHVRVSYSDGLTPTQNNVPFNFDTTAHYAELSNSLPRFGDGNIQLAYSGSPNYPVVGDSITVYYHIAYAKVSTGGWIGVYEGDISGAGTKDNRFYLRVKTGNTFGPSAFSPYPIVYTDAVVTVYDQQNHIPATDVSISGSLSSVTVPIGSTGLSATLDMTHIKALAQKGLREGDVYYIDYFAPETSASTFGGVILSGPAAIGNTSTQTVSIKFRSDVSGLLSADDFYAGVIPVVANASDGTVTISSSDTWTKHVTSFSAGYAYPTIVGSASTTVAPRIYLTWRASRIPAGHEGVIAIESATDLAQFGNIDQDNDLAFALFAARQGAGAKPVYALRTASGSLEDFIAALGKIESIDYVYSLSAVSENKAIGKLVADHCEAMSANDVKNFRRSYFGVDSPGSYKVIDLDTAGAPYTATVTAYTGGNLRVTFNKACGLVTKGVANGDFVTIGGASYFIQEVLSDDEYNSELILKTGPNVAITDQTAITISRSDTPDSQADYVINVAEYFDSRRACVVWVEGGTTYDATGALVQTKNKYVAAFIAGLRSNVIPWLGISRKPVDFLVSAAPMYLRYKKSVLNRLASYGVFIVTQTSEDGTIYVRHQLTTDVSEGTLAYEDSVGCNVDDIAFQFKDAMEPLIGVTNVTPETIRNIGQRGMSILVSATQSQTDPLVGPQLIQFYDENGVVGAITVKAHPIFKDRIMCRSKIEVPIPNNTTIVDLVAVSGISI